MTITDPLDRNPQPGAWAVYREIFERREYGDTSPIADDELKSTYGPQWKAVLDLIREAALLTTEQRESIYSAYDEAWKSDDFRSAYQAVFVGVSPGGAALRALLAFVVYDYDAIVAAALARRHEIKPEHYALLTAPWVAITNRPVHPDDAAVAA